jgi:SAM-dependent methyltransferase
MRPLPEGRDVFDSLELDNEGFWQALLGHVVEDHGVRERLTLLDVGCHRGGLLVRAATRLSVETLVGIEPLTNEREIAARRWSAHARVARTFAPEQWAEVAASSVDVVLCHEVLYLVSPLAPLMANLRRCLRSNGAAYVVLGCHTENPIWPRWRQLLRESGVQTFDYSPFDIINAASDAGLATSIRPLRRDGWVRYEPRRATYGFETAGELFDHHYRHKLLFRMVPA